MTKMTLSESQAIKRERLKTELQNGIDDLDAGRSIDGESFFAEMIDEVDHRK